MESPVKLTQTVQKGGCAAKIPALELRAVLKKVTFPDQNAFSAEFKVPGSEAPLGLNYLVDSSLFDDASVIALSHDLALIQTIDFFTPIVDDPKRFGKIAAANALSDVYAMGGKPLTALAVLAYPLGVLSSEIVAQVLQGASDQLTRAGCTLSGGHSIDDDTLKFGLSVTGVVHPERIWKNSGAKVGDQLILTKGLGTGTITAGLKRQVYSESTESVQAALHSMEQLNNVIDLLNGRATSSDPSHGSDYDLTKIHAATDITGFGLAGHATQMARASQVSINFDGRSLPVLFGARESLAAGHLTKAHRTNREYTKGTIEHVGNRTETDDLLAFDPQTSGGLLLSVSRDATDDLLKRISSEFPLAARVGEVVESAPGSERVVVQW